MAQFVAEQWVAAPLEDVFRFFCDPANFPRIMPSELHVRLVALNLVPHVRPPLANVGVGPVVESGGTSRQVAGAGTELDLRFRYLPGVPFRGRWLARIVEFEALSYFRDVQIIGPFKKWVHTHSFERRVKDGREGTLLRDAIEFEVGFGPIGTLVERFVIQPRLQKTFAHRRTEIERMLQAARENRS